MGDKEGNRVPSLGNKKITLCSTLYKPPQPKDCFTVHTGARFTSFSFQSINSFNFLKNNQSTHFFKIDGEIEHII